MQKKEISTASELNPNYKNIFYERGLYFKGLKQIFIKK